MGRSVFAGTALGGVFRSTDNGMSWASASSGLTNGFVRSLAVKGSILFAGTDNGICLSPDSGADWYPASPDFAQGTVVQSLAVGGNNLYAGTEGGGVFVSTNNGTSWTESDSGLTDRDIWTISVSGTTVFVGTDYNGVFKSTNNGTSWSPASSGLTDTVVHSLAVTKTNLYAGTDDGVWRRPLSEITAAVPISRQVPLVFRLFQNYPNPFNPSTTIRYALPNRAHVTLTVFSTLGQQVATLVNENQEAGYHDVRFDGSGLASGVYFYRIQAGDFVQTKRLLILR
jgi:ligand-binding sensor domain-containing protein